MRRLSCIGRLQEWVLFCKWRSERHRMDCLYSRNRWKRHENKLYHRPHILQENRVYRCSFETGSCCFHTQENLEMGTFRKESWWRWRKRERRRRLHTQCSSLLCRAECATILFLYNIYIYHIHCILCLEL